MGQLPPKRIRPVMTGPRPKTTVIRKKVSEDEGNQKPVEKPIEKPVEKTQDPAPVVASSSVSSTSAASASAEPTAPVNPTTSATIANPASSVTSATTQVAETPTSAQPSVEPSSPAATAKKAEPKKTGKEPPKKNVKASAEKKSGGGGRGVLVFLLLLSLGVNGFLVYDRYTGMKEVEGELQTAQASVVEYKNDIERKVAEISHLQDSIKIIMSEKEALGLALDDERAKIAQLEELKTQVRKKQVSINSLNRKLKNYQNDYHKVKANVENLVAENLRLISERRELEEAMHAKDDSMRLLAEMHHKMAEKVNTVAALKAENIDVTIYNSGGKEMKKSSAYRSMFVGNIKATLVLAENKVADPGKKDIYLRITEPSGAPLMSGNKSFEINGKKTFYTEKQTINFNNTKQKVSFLYSKGSRYLPGKYRVEFYDENGNNMGQGAFVVKN
jgi:hypothetical protein